MNEMSRMFSGSRSKDQWMVPWPYRGELVGVVVVTCTPLGVDRLAFKLGGGEWKILKHITASANEKRRYC